MIKKVFALLAILFFIKCSVISQENQEKRTDISPYGKQYSELDFSMRFIAAHEKLTQFTYFDLNFVDTRLQNYLSHYLFFAPIGEPEINFTPTSKSISMKYEKKAQYGFTKPRGITVKYNLFDNNGLLIIKSCEISGYWLYITDLYVNYWTTDLNFESAKKKELVVNYLLQDRIALTLNPINESGFISITNTTINSISQFQTILAKGVQLNLANDIDSIKQKKLKETENKKKIEETERINQKNKRLSFISQTYFVNTDNLILRNSPEDDFDISLILHAPAKIRSIYCSGDLKDDSAIMKKFEFVKFVFSENYSGLSGSKRGWVMRKYLVNQKSEIVKYDTVPPSFFDSTKEFHDGNMYDEFDSDVKYIYPKYKGGDEPKSFNNFTKSPNKVKPKK